MHPGPEIHVLRGMNNDENDDAPYLSLLRTHTVDLDFNFDLAEVQEFIQAYGLSAEWVKSYFSPLSTQIIPMQLRSDFCLDCMEEAISEIGLPVYLKTWRLVLRPYCEKHGCVLLSVDAHLYRSIDIAVEIFEHACAFPHEVQRQKILLDKYSDVQNIARDIFVRIGVLLNQAPSRKVRCKIENFLMMLMRIALAPELWGSYASIANFKVVADRKFDNEKPLPMFCQTPLRATGAARARSLYLIGLLLGWVSEFQATRSRPESDFYLETSAIAIWRSVKWRPQVKSILQLYNSELLNVEMLEGWGEF